ncbi:cytoplasm protein [Phakopsora pachyrhizi]|nr:cytoplasm protein [Phakopsora pachyrhizi]
MTLSNDDREVSSTNEPIRDRLNALKALMRDHKVSIYIVPSQDAHGSEYICSADERREFLTGFTGSAGTAIVLLDEDQSYLFTDGRYFNQASKELDPSSWTLVKQGINNQTSWQAVVLNYIRSKTRDDHDLSDGHSFSGIRIGCDPSLVSIEEVKDLVNKLEQFPGSGLVSVEQNLVDVVWDSLRPNRTHNPIIELDLKHAGVSSSEKLSKLYQSISSFSDSDQEALGMVLSALDEIAWLFNLRGSDIIFNPVFFSYAWIGIDSKGIKSIVLFVEEDQLDGSVKDYLNKLEVEIIPYGEIWNYLDRIKSQISESSTKKKSCKVLISNKSSWAIETRLGGGPSTIKINSPIQELKALKNNTEINGFKECHLRDGAALVSYFAWLEDQLLVKNNKTLNEFDGSIELEKRRRRFSPELFRGPSFQTISSSGKNAAIIHYSPDSVKSDLIDKDSIYLCDSGGQYLDGTTDVTRTLHFGKPKSIEIRAFTRVLQGHIALDLMIFPEKTTGYLLDSFARQYLWRDGLDYRHGTGHGVGHYLNVHEGPQGINTRVNYNDVSLKPGMVLSNEPGYYKDEEFGIRIESMMVVVKKNFFDKEQEEDKTKDGAGEDKKSYFGFENLTLCPIQVKLIDRNLLSAEQIKWINDYHRVVYEKLSSLLIKHEDKVGLDYLKRECKSI